MALGFDPRTADRLRRRRLPVTRWGTLKVDHRTMMTALPGVFAAATSARPSLVVWGIATAASQPSRCPAYIQRRRSTLAVGGGVTDDMDETGFDYVAGVAADHAKLAAEAHLDLTEHDACGVGLVASLDGRARREVVQAGIDALKAVWHRGAVDADGKTGDGAGIHVEIPQDFFAEVVRAGGDQVQPGRIAVGMVFLPKTDLGAQERCRQIVETEVLNAGYAIYSWRQVPIDIACIGEKANATRRRSSRSCSGIRAASTTTPMSGTST
jgi:hypothetical protein